MAEVELEEVVVLGAAGLEAVVPVVVVALEVAGLDVVEAGLGATVGLWAAARDAVAARIANDFNRYVGLMVPAILLGGSRSRQAPRFRSGFLRAMQS
jgi:hypothetical protein